MIEAHFLKNLTAEQKEATLKFDTDVAVTANAGSGKTTMLVSKYLYLQLFHSDKFNHKNIVAITFTKKAASEIRFKIRKSILELLNEDKESNNKDESLTEEQIDILKTINRNIMNLEVGTIHRFCRKLIRDFGYRIDIQPNFTVIEESEILIVYRKLILETLSDANSPVKDNIFKAVHYLGYEETINLLIKLIFKKEHLKNHEEFYKGNIDEINDFILTKVKNLYKNILFEYLNEMYELVESAEGLKQENVEQFEKLIQEFKSNYDNAEYSIEKICEDLEEIRTVRKGKGVALIINALLSKAKAAKFNEIIKILKVFPAFHKKDRELLLPNRIEVGKSLTAIAQVVSQKYEALNLKLNRLDNDSTLDAALKLLEIPDILRIVQYDYSYLMIDEFQDTDDKQLRIANKLRENGKIKLFVVGDDKQSIYRFRNADVRVFKEVRASLPEENRLELNTSFRSEIEVNCFINDLFEPIMKASRSAFDVEYNPIVSTKNQSGENKTRINLMFYRNPHRKIKEEERVKAEIQLIKSLHNLMVEGGAKPSDICILANSGSDLVKLSSYIADKGLEYKILSGKGFFNKNEIKEVISFLRFIDDTENDLFLSATLKSAFFNYVEEDFYEICLRKDKNISFWEHFQEYAELNGNERDLQTIKTIKKFIRFSNKLPLSNIIIKMIDDTNWNEFYNDKEERDIVYNNLFKFMGICRSLEDREFGNLSEQFEILEKRLKLNKDAEEGGDSTNAINLSTIHSAKGLEFEHIILYKMDMYSTKAGYGRTICLDEDYGINVEIPATIEDYDEFGVRKSIIDELILTNYKIVSNAENIRLYYVALTRAKKSIHIVVAKSKDGMQFNELKSVFGEIGESETITKESNIGVYDFEKQIVVNKSIGYSINVDYDLAEIDDFDFDMTEDNGISNADLTMYMDKIDASEEEINFSATKLNMFKNMEYQKFKKTYVYGLPFMDSKILDYNEIEEDDSRNLLKIMQISGKDLGVLFHYLMEIIGELLDNGNKLNIDRFESELSTKAEEYDIRFDADIPNQIQTIFNNVLNSKFIERNFDKLVKSEKEFELEMMFGTHIFKAIFDAFILDGNTAEIWDWKTNNFKENDTIESHAERNEFQMSVYALFAMRYKPELEKVITRLFYVRKADENANDEKWIYTKEYGKDDMRAIENNISEVIGGIKVKYPVIYPVKKITMLGD